jgi:hypothetical protein
MCMCKGVHSTRIGLIACVLNNRCTRLIFDLFLDANVSRLGGGAVPDVPVGPSGHVYGFGKRNATQHHQARKGDVVYAGIDGKHLQRAEVCGACSLERMHPQELPPL